ncbi:MAG: hypothetical protein IJE43_13420 [Alphaproteobacteria bacterium]|nr:hypothetical protein [Alphaproteobacteria bacterium]
MIVIKKCYVDKNLHIITDDEQLDDAVGIVSISADKTTVEIVFLNPIANDKNLDEATASIKEWMAKNGYKEAYFPSIASCVVANALRTHNPELCSCHLGMINLQSPRSRDFYARLNSEGRVACADTSKKLKNVYVAIRLSLDEFKQMNSSSEFPDDYFVEVGSVFGGVFA